MTSAPTPDGSTVSEVTAVLGETLGIEDRVAQLDASTSLFGSLPELDSMAVLEVLAAFEERFGIEIVDEDVTGEIFETVGTLSAFIEAKTASRAPRRGAE